MDQIELQVGRFRMAEIDVFVLKNDLVYWSYLQRYTDRNFYNKPGGKTWNQKQLAGCFLYSSYLNGFHFRLSRAMVWIVGSFPDQVSSPSKQVLLKMSRSASVCWQLECRCRLITETRGGERKLGFCGGFYALICVIGKQIDLSYLP